MRDTATGIQYSSLSAGIANAVGTHQCQYFRTFSTFSEDYFRGLCCLVWLAGVLDVYPTALYSVIFLIFGDLIRGRRTTPSRLYRNNIIPTLKDAVPGDLSLVLPYRIMTDIIEMIYQLDKLAPGG